MCDRVKIKSVSTHNALTRALYASQFILRQNGKCQRNLDRIPVGARFSAPVQTGRRAQPASYTVGTGGFPGVKRPGSDADHLHRPAPRLKKEYSYASISFLGLRVLS
jgi:hypothetical protein